MSVYRPEKSPFYHFDFRVERLRFHGSTGRTNRRAAEAVERSEREKAKAEAKAARLGAGAPLTLADAITRYWLEVGRLKVNSGTVWTDLQRILSFLGAAKMLAEITDADVAGLVAWRRGHTKSGKAKRRNGEPMPVVSPATVNRSTTEVLRKVFNRAKRTWKQSLPGEPAWADHMLDEPDEHVRELQVDEAVAITDATRDDYAPILAFERATGLRMRECLLRWSNVDFRTGQITTKGKGGRTVTTPITPTVRAILEPLVGNDPVWVFTYVAARTRTGRVRGKRYPITYNGLQSQWRRTRSAAGVTDFRFHDFRHDVATKLLRATGNLKMVQKALNHADIKTTNRYAHVLDEEVAAAMQAASEQRAEDEKKSRKNSRTGSSYAA